MRVFHTIYCYLICVFLACAAPLAEAQSSPDLLYEARAGDVEAMRELELRLLKGIRVRVRDIHNGAKWLQKASALGDAESSYQVGRLWDAGNTNGTFSMQEQPLFHYTTSVEWKNGLPWKAKARIDFSSSKSRIIKRSKASK